MTIRVLVADDQDLIRSGLLAVLGVQPDIEVVGEAADGRQAVEAAASLRPDVVLLDIRMPVMDGIEATRLIADPSAQTPTAVVILTTFDNDELVLGALRAGATGFLLKDCGRELLVQAVRAAAAGDALISPRITRRLLRTFAESAESVVAVPAEPAEPLTAREEEVLLAVAAGSSNTEIARDLHIGLSTVKTHLGSLTMKLGARNRVDLAIWAHETGRTRREGAGS